MDSGNREKEESLVETGDVDRRRARHTLADRDDELPHHGALHHRAHLRHVEVGDLLAEGVEPADEQKRRVMDTYEEHAAEFSDIQAELSAFMERLFTDH